MVTPSIGDVPRQLVYDSGDHGVQETRAFREWLDKLRAIALAGGSGGGAPVDATYLTLSLNATLTNERVLTAGTNITFTDTGANGTLTIDAAGGGATSPLTTKGDVWGYSTVDARIPVGANATVLTADSTQALGVKWAAPASATITTKDEGSTLSSTVTTLDFVGAGVTATGGGATTTVTIPGTVLLTVKDEGSTVGTAAGITSIDFVGGEVTATGVGAAATVTIPDVFPGAGNLGKVVAIVRGFAGNYY